MSNKALHGVSSLLQHCIERYVVNEASYMHSAVCYMYRDLQCTLQSTEFLRKN